MSTFALSASPAFVHLRLHSEYSIVDGIVRLDDAIARAVADRMPALALTDLNNLFGMVKFYRAARSAGIKPIIGCDVWIDNENDRDKPSRLLLLCRSRGGYLFLCDLLSRAYRGNRFRGRALIRKGWLAEAGADGLIVLSGGELGDIGMALVGGDVKGAQSRAAEWAALFPRRFYIEAQRASPQAISSTQAALRIASALRLPVVATHPIQFLSPDDFRAHEARVCIAEARVLADRRRPKNFTEEQYFKSQAEMAALFVDIPLALENSVEIAKRCNFSLELGKTRLPQFPVPEGIGLDAYLREQAETGLAVRLAGLYQDEFERAAQLPRYRERLVFELNIIVQMGFSGYFLIVADFINWAKRNDIPVGPGRGSGAGSLVAYSLNITDLDPLKYDLLFERFLNPERVSMPDFDIDFCMDGRERVIDYVKQKFGADSVSQIATFGTMAAKAVVRDVARVLDLPYSFGDQLAKLIPFAPGRAVTLRRRTDAKDDKTIYAREAEPAIEEREKEEEEVAELLQLAEKLEGVARNVGMHAGGVLIAPGKLSDFCPLYCADSEDSTVSQFDMEDVEKIGLVKFDFLGLRTLTILDWAVQSIREQRTETGEQGTANSERQTANPPCPPFSKGGESGTHAAFASPASGYGESNTQGGSIPPLKKGGDAQAAGGFASESNSLTPGFDLSTIPLDDAPTYQLIAAGNTAAVFQLESRGMRDMLKQARPDRFEDIIALVALYRPGPMDLIPTFCKGKHGAAVEYLDPQVAPMLSPILGPTYGVCVYQEQVMQIAQVIGGYSLGSADLLRRAMGKKKLEEMIMHREIFSAGAQKNGVAAQTAGKIFDFIEKFAGYGFNKSHAAAYALIAYQTAYLKKHYAAAFMAATLSSDMDDTDKVHGFYEDCVANGLQILPPDIHASAYRFMPVNAVHIRYGLGAVKGTGESAIASIIRAREEDGAFRDLFDFCRRVDKRVVNRRVVESLIRAGAFDSLTDHRAGLLAAVGIAMESAEQLNRHKSQNTLFGALADDTGAVTLPVVPRWPDNVRLQNEKLALGFYLSGHPFRAYVDDLKAFVRTGLDKLPAKNQTTLLAGIVDSFRILQTRRGRMAAVTLDDGAARVEITVFNELFDAHRALLKVDQLLIAEVEVRPRKRDPLAESAGGGGAEDMRITATQLYSLAAARTAFAKALRLKCNGSSNGRQLMELLSPYRRGATAASAADGSGNGNLGGRNIGDTARSNGGGANGHASGASAFRGSGTTRQTARACQVAITYNNGSAICEVELGDEWRVDLHDNLLQALNDALRSENVTIVY
ncbi:MAG: DNA polymerase III subunit alpha [Burkholderiales bacterium]|nr:DNA polymerase III subunit alpha [Burkholderiales bacterium]